MGHAIYQITLIESQKHDENRVNVYLDGSFAFGLEKDVLIRHHLHEGDTINDQVIDGVLLSEERTQAKEKALSLLSYRARSTKELKNRLKEKGFTERTIQRVIKDFLRVGLLDDRNFASSYVQTRMLQKPMAKRLLRVELGRKGINETLTESAINESYGCESEFEVARSLVKKKWSRKTETDERKKKKKIADFLLRRGFDWEVITSIFQDLGES